MWQNAADLIRSIQLNDVIEVNRAKISQKRMNQWDFSTSPLALSVWVAARAEHAHDASTNFSTNRNKSSVEHQTLDDVKVLQLTMQEKLKVTKTILKKK